MRIFSAVLDIAAMNSGWRKRLKQAIEADGRTLRSISLAAKLGPNFVTQFMTTGRTPSIEKFLKLTDTLGISPTKVLTGVEISPEDEELLRLATSLSPAGRERLLQLFQEIQDREPR